MYNTSRICPNYLKGKSKFNIHLYLIDCSLLNIQCQIFQDENNREKYGELNRDDKLNLLAYMEHGTLQT